MSDRVLRNRIESNAADLRSLEAPGEAGGVSMIVELRAESAYPTVPAAMFACSPIEVEGPEVEGAAAVFLADFSRVLYAYNLGQKIPPVGTKLIVHDVGARWVFRYGD